MVTLIKPLTPPPPVLMIPKQYLIYLAGSITHDGDGGVARRDEVVAAIRKSVLAGHVRVLSPLRGKEWKGGVWTGDFVSPRAVAFRDHYDIKRCDAVLMNLEEATKVSIGCMIELGWATAYGKPTIVIMEDSNLHCGHPMIEGLPILIVQTVQEAIDLLDSIL